jgi:hypothetical protein
MQMESKRQLSEREGLQGKWVGEEASLPLALSPSLI